MGLTGIVCKTILYGTNKVEVIGLDRFLQRLEKRKDVEKRERGLLTVSNHISVVDDPLMWGIMPWRYIFNPQSLRWGLGAHDICYANPLFSNFFMAGQTLPMHRLQHSPDGGGLFQPTVTQAIRLLSSQPYGKPLVGPSLTPASSSSSQTTTPPAADSDPFTTGALTYSTTPTDRWPAPSAYPSNRHSWVHVFPEGLVHQHPDRGLRYFKWGVARLILESEPAPDVVPIFVDGTDRIMPEDRAFPRFLPRLGQRVRVAVGDAVDFEQTFGDLRRQWAALAERSARRRRWELRLLEDGGRRGKGGAAEEEEEGRREGTVTMMGELSDDLKYGAEAEAIRVEVAHRVRNEILKLRRSLGYPDEDPALGLAETWAKDPHKKQYKSNVDGSLVNQE
ncbi:uncharacterized protein E0L32_007247 [Thyridium curvatum]|uniref:Tafazzin family protein n=1 Tax=Thyridium curvatum TaxID=1093900 RepID=A0A507AQ81_9PEZI|nr:uncharacterized protein E0L32_007247 [Thyridium curvatum]TPX12132.1 hypothetical protein E0L32_007247 [Thyridium curvatum]